MKKLLLVPCMLLSMYSFAQSRVSEMHPAYDELTPTELQKLENDWDKKRAAQLSRTRAQGGPVNQRMSHSDIAYFLFDANLRTVFSPFAPDSNYIQVFTTPDNINTHGFGQTFDPTSEGFSVLGQDYFAEVDPYTIDTFYIGARYRTSAPTSGLTGDTLQITYFSATNTNSTNWYVGIGYPAGTFPNQTNRINVLPPRYTGNAAIGTPGTLNAPNKVVIKYPLTATDTAVNYIKVVPPTPISIPAGHKLGVLCTFIAGQSYNPATQVYYRSGGTGDVNNMSWLYHTNQNDTDPNAYFLEPLTLGSPSNGISNTLFSNTRYKAWTGSNAFRNDYVAPSATRGNLIDFWVSGNSSVGLKENQLDKSLSLYPNPSNGIINLKMVQGGIYDLSILDMTGKTIHQEQLNFGNNSTIDRDFSEFPKGVYLLSINGDRYSKTIKLTLK